MNPLFGYGSPGGFPPNPMNNMMNMIQRFNQFRQTFQGNPQQQVQELLQSGKMTQEQFNQYKAQAQQMMQFFR